MPKIMKATVRSGRATAGGKVYNANHNTKKETRQQERHIDHDRTEQNLNFQFTNTGTVRRCGSFDANTVETNHAVDVVEVTETTKHTEVVATTEPVQIETTVEAVPTVEYDALQKVFIGFTLDTTQEDVMNLINEYGLEYSSQKYNGTPKSIQYKIAFDKGVTPQKYADEGDHIEVSFNVADGTLLHAEYFNLKAFKTAVLYGYGTYWDFRSDEPNNQYSGHYYHKPGDTKGGITIKYSNGRSSETGYHQATSAEDALLNVLT